MIVRAAGTAAYNGHMATLEELAALEQRIDALLERLPVEADRGSGE